MILLCIFSFCITVNVFYIVVFSSYCFLIAWRRERVRGDKVYIHCKFKYFNKYVFNIHVPVFISIDIFWYRNALIIKFISYLSFYLSKFCIPLELYVRIYWLIYTTPENRLVKSYVSREAKDLSSGCTLLLWISHTILPNNVNTG